MSKKFTDRTIYRMDFTLTAKVKPSGKTKRVTKAGIMSDMEKLRKVKFEKVSCPYADWLDTSITKHGDKWCIEYMFDCENTSIESAHLLLRAYYMVFSQGIGMLNGTGFFKYEYEFKRDDFEVIKIDVGYLQSDDKTIFFPKNKN